jgi:hypothetical protein
VRGKKLIMRVDKHFYHRTEWRKIFLDCHSEVLFALIALILVFSLMDAFFTLILVDHGATELNPLMAFYLNIGPAVFIMVKYGMTSLSIFVLLVSSNNSSISHKICTSSLFLMICLTVAAVIPWQLYLIFRNVL